MWSDSRRTYALAEAVAVDEAGASCVSTRTRDVDAVADEVVEVCVLRQHRALARAEAVARVLGPRATGRGRRQVARPLVGSAARVCRQGGG